MVLSGLTIGSLSWLPLFSIVVTPLVFIAVIARSLMTPLLLYISVDSFGCAMIYLRTFVVFRGLIETKVFWQIMGWNFLLVNVASCLELSTISSFISHKIYNFAMFGQTS